MLGLVAANFGGLLFLIGVDNADTRASKPIMAVGGGAFVLGMILMAFGILWAR
jgi:hypothetical protein